MTERVINAMTYTHSQIILRLLGYIGPLKRELILSIIARTLNLACGVTILTLAVWWLSEIIIEKVSTGFWFMVLILIGIGFFKGWFRYLEQFLGHYVAFHLLSILRNKLYEKVEPLAPAALNMTRTGDLVSRAISDVNRVEVFYAHTIAPAFNAVIVSVAVLAWLAYFDYRFALILLPAMVIVGLLVPFISSRMGGKYSAELRPAVAEVKSHLTDSIQGLSEVVSFNYGERRSAEINLRSEKLSALQAKIARVMMVQDFLIEFFVGLAVLAVAGFALVQVQIGEMPLVNLAPVILLSIVGLEPIREISVLANDHNQTLASAERLFSLMDTAPKTEDLVEVSPPEPIDSSLGFSDVKFAYDAKNGDTEWVLNGLNFKLEPNKRIAIVGGSGEGKSTIVNLLLRFWDVNEGSVELGGHDVKDFTLNDLRQRIAVVAQSTYTFNTSIRENILLGDPNAREEEVIIAAKKANLDEFVETLPEGYETEVGEMGTKISGGQRQRVALARAILKDSPILILDEATSSLDVQNEREIQETIRELMKDRTTLIIAHRLSAISDVDEILVLEKGTIAERGTHKELLEKEGVYARLFAEQENEIAGM